MLSKLASSPNKAARTVARSSPSFEVRVRELMGTVASDVLAAAGEHVVKETESLTKQLAVQEQASAAARESAESRHRREMAMVRQQSERAVKNTISNHSKELAGLDAAMEKLKETHAADVDEKLQAQLKDIRRKEEGRLMRFRCDIEQNVRDEIRAERDEDRRQIRALQEELTAADRTRTILERNLASSRAAVDRLTSDLDFARQARTDSEEDVAALRRTVDSLRATQGVSYYRPY